MKLSPSFVCLILVVCQTAGADTARFQRELRRTLNQSPLSAVERVQHVMNRLAYGTNPSTRRFTNLLRKNSFGDPDDAATNEAIITFLSNNLARRGRVSTAIQNKVNESYPMAGYSPAEVDASWRALGRPYYDKRDELNAVRREIATYTSATPPRPVPGHLLRREESLLLQVADLSRYIVEFQQQLRLAEQAEQVAYAILDENPLIWILTDFWFNHFNVSTEKVGIDHVSYRNVITARMFGSFEDMLISTARHPAMLLYLDNGYNRTIFKADPKKKGAYIITRYPNENYAREVMELHTFGMAPSANSTANTYNQEDVRQAALILSGWNLDGMDPRLAGPRRPLFVPSNNVPIEKTVMRRKFGPGYGGGVDFLKFLANHSRTSTHLAAKLVHRFVAEENVPETSRLKSRVANLLQSSRGDLGAVYEEIFASPEFWSRRAFRSKVKQPLSLVASAIRASGIITSQLDKPTLAGAVNRVFAMGQRLLAYTAPTGFPDSNQYWMSTNNALGAVQWGFASASFKGDPAGVVGQRYGEWESYANSAPTPLLKGYRAFNGAVSVFDFSFLQERLQYPNAVVALDGLLQKPAGIKSDRGGGKDMPLRTVVGLITGSADFIRQ